MTNPAPPTSTGLRPAFRPATCRSVGRLIRFLLTWLSNLGWRHCWTTGRAPWPLAATCWAVTRSSKGGHSCQTCAALTAASWSMGKVIVAIFHTCSWPSPLQRTCPCEPGRSLLTGLAGTATFGPKSGTANWGAGNWSTFSIITIFSKLRECLCQLWNSVRRCSAIQRNSSWRRSIRAPGPAGR